MVPMAGRNYTYSGRLSDTDANRIEDFRQAGLQGDRSLVPAMVDAIKSPAHLGFTYTTMHALAQLGATEAVPVLETYTQDASADQDETGGDLRNFSGAARARLLAESEAHAISDSKSASLAKVRRFYKELKMTPADLNDALVAYYPPVAKPSVGVQGNITFITPASDGAPAHPIGVYAVRELADMMYHGGYKDCAFLPEVSQVNFASDYPSALKMRLAPLAPIERLNTMLRELSQKKVLKHWDDYEIQLASNEGLLASHSAADLLKKMEAHPEQYDEPGFTALVRVIWGTGDREQAPLVQHLLENRLISTGNLPIWDLTKGVKGAREPAY